MMKVFNDSQQLPEKEFKVILAKLFKAKKVVTPRDITDMFYTGYYGFDSGGYMIVKRFPEYEFPTFVQRLNRLWFYPVFVASMPFQWLFLGKIGVNTYSRFGKALTRLIGKY